MAEKESRFVRWVLRSLEPLTPLQLVVYVTLGILFGELLRRAFP